VGTTTENYQRRAGVEEEVYIWKKKTPANRKAVLNSEPRQPAGGAAWVENVKSVLGKKKLPKTQVGFS